MSYIIQFCNDKFYGWAAYKDETGVYIAYGPCYSGDSPEECLKNILGDKI